MIDGTLANPVPFTAKAYIEEYNYHYSKIIDLYTSKIHGAEFRAVLELWATVGWYVPAISRNFLLLIITYSSANARMTVKKLKADLSETPRRPG